jgi:hypothetical protein
MDTLVDRINEGMTTEQDGHTVARLLERLAAYETTLRRIAVHGTGEPAMLATRALGAAVGGGATWRGESCPR